MSSFANRFATNAGILYVRLAITMFLSLYTTRLVLSALGLSDFGLFNLVGGVIAMLGFFNNSMASASQRFISYAQGEGDIEKVRRIFNMSFVLHAGITIIIFLLLEIAGYFIFNGILNINPEKLGAARIIYQFMIVSTLFTVIAVPYEAVIISHENLTVSSTVGVIEAFMKLGIALYIRDISQDKLVSYGLLMAIIPILSFLLRRGYCKYKYSECKLNFYSYYDQPLLWEIGTFAGWSLLGSSSSMISNYGQIIVLNIFFGSLINSAQAIAIQVSAQLSVFSATMLKALNPIMDKSEGSGNRSLLLKATEIGSRVSFFLLLIFYIPALIETKYILRLWLNTVPDYTVLFCRLSLIRNLLEQLFVTLYGTVAAVGTIRKFQIYSSIINIIPIIVSYVLFSFGSEVYSIYIVFIIFSLVNGLVTLYAARTFCALSIKSYANNVIFPCIGSFVIIFSLSILPLFFDLVPFFRLIVVSCVSSITFFFTFWQFGLTYKQRLEITRIYKIKMALARAKIRYGSNCL